MHPGNATVPKSRRAFFLDHPCNLKPTEVVTFVLSLHGGGMVGNWHRHYFPLMDLKDKYRLVVATRSGERSVERARVYVYPECRGGHVVADVIRLDKGHTEGLEPNVTEEIVKLMLSSRRR